MTLKGLFPTCSKIAARCSSLVHSSSVLTLPVLGNADGLLEGREQNTSALSQTLVGVQYLMTPLSAVVGVQQEKEIDYLALLETRHLTAHLAQIRFYQLCDLRASIAFFPDRSQCGVCSPGAA